MTNVLRVPAVIILITFVLVAMSTIVYAQPTFELGIKAGMTIAKLRGDVEQSESGTIDLGDGYTMVGSITEKFDESKLGFVGGVYATIHINKQFGIRLEGLYAKKGGKGNNSGLLDVYDPTDTYVGSVNLSGENIVSFDYFEFPLLAVLSFPIGPRTSFDLFAGPAIAVNTKAEVEITTKVSLMGASETETQVVDLEDEIEDTDFGGVFGAGVSFHLPAVVLFAEARMDYGFKDIDKFEESDIKNGNFGFIAGIALPLAPVK